MWNRFPPLIQAIITGLIVAIAGTIPWAFLVRLNLDHLPSVPWCIIPASIYLWFFWKYVNGAGWPRSTAAIRKKTARSNQLSSEVWGSAIVAGILGLVSLVIFSGLLNRMIKLPKQDVSELSHVPFASLFFILLMSAAFAGVVEETAFRGYMQKPIEQRHGPVIAIVVTGSFFGFMHFTHPETTFALLPFYFSVATIYGMLAYITNSILPGMILHAVGNVFGSMDLLLRGQSEWQQSAVPQPLIWETGTDGSFWLSCVGLIVIGTITVWAYTNVAKEMKRSQSAG
ncbi:MAG: CPBP family intramembrane metalloprotease [Bacteroidetes bacterium]|nr:MAG: CPBP family intramembrane metalloprotease [Bacteroidota bacterium]